VQRRCGPATNMPISRGRSARDAFASTVMVPENLAAPIPENLADQRSSGKHDGDEHERTSTRPEGGDGPPSAPSRDPGSSPRGSWPGGCRGAHRRVDSYSPSRARGGRRDACRRPRGAPCPRRRSPIAGSPMVDVDVARRPAARERRRLGPWPLPIGKTGDSSDRHPPAFLPHVRTPDLRSSG